MLPANMRLGGLNEVPVYPAVGRFAQCRLNKFSLIVAGRGLRSYVWRKFLAGLANRTCALGCPRRCLSAVASRAHLSPHSGALRRQRLQRSPYIQFQMCARQYRRAPPKAMSPGLAHQPSRAVCPSREGWPAALQEMLRAPIAAAKRRRSCWGSNLPSLLAEETVRDWCSPRGPQPAVRKKRLLGVSRGTHTRRSLRGGWVDAKAKSFSSLEARASGMRQTTQGQVSLEV